MGSTAHRKWKREAKARNRAGRCATKLCPQVLAWRDEHGRVQLSPHMSKKKGVMYCWFCVEEEECRELEELELLVFGSELELSSS